MRKVISEEAELLKKNANKLKRELSQIKKKYEYISKADADVFQYTFLRAQAEEVYKTYKTLNFSPFKSLFTQFKTMVTDEIFMDNFYLMLNEFGELTVDEKRLKKFLPINADKVDS